METSDIISLVSLSISVFAGIYSWVTRRKLDKQQLQINDYTLLKNKKIEENEKKAIVCANTFKINESWRIRVYNKGMGTARNIRIHSKDITEPNSGIRLLIKQTSYPILNKDDHFDIVMMLFEGHAYSPIIKLVWDDDFGNDRSREQALDLTF